MSTAVQVCSNAIVELGGRPINSFAELSDRALAAANLYPQVRDSVLRSHPWNCSIKRVVLSPDSAAPAFEWDYAYTLPGDWLRTLSITEHREREPFASEGGKLLCNLGAVYLRYVFRNDNPATWDALLTRAMTLAMAAVLAIPVTESESRANSMRADFREMMKQARSIDGTDDPPDEIDDYPLLMARL
jgi:hypothetical protein